MIEICDGIDNDCNELVDDGQTIYGLTQYLDEDEDGYGRSDSVVMFCSLQFGYTLDDGIMMMRYQHLSQCRRDL